MGKIAIKNNLDTELSIEHIDEEQAKSLTTKDFKYIRDTIKDLSTIDNPSDGDVVFIKGYHEINDGGGGLFIYNSNEPKNNHNGGTVIDATNIFPDDWNDQTKLKNWFSNNNTGNGCFIRVYNNEVYPEWFGAKGDGNYDDILPIQNAINVCSKIFFSKNYYISNSINIDNNKQLIGIKGTIFTDNTDNILYLEKSKNIIIKNLSLYNSFNSKNASCVKGSLYSCNIENNKFSCENGKAIYIIGTNYSVENRIKENYFYGCKYGIYTEKESYSVTDMWIIDNKFWHGNKSDSTTIINDIYLENPSGSIIRGNHMYGNSSEAMIKIKEGVNISITENYFERSDNPRLYIICGNPSSFNIANNKFWGGDGTKTDFIDDISSLIKIKFSLYNYNKITFIGNIFENGLNDIPIFCFLNGDWNSVKNIDIILDKTNIINGSYSLAVIADSSSSVNSSILNRIVTDNEYFNYYSTEQNKTPWSIACYKFIQEDSGYADGYYNLPYSTKWLNNRTIYLINDSSTETIHINTSNQNGIIGRNIVYPGEVCEIFLKLDTYHIRVTTLKNKVSYSADNVTIDRSFDADNTSTDELADVLGTLINDLKSINILK